MSFRLLLLLVFFLWNALLPCSARDSSAAASSRTNLLLITIDTLRPDHLGCYGDRQARTPNIDALAAAGTRFENAYTPVPITLPSHTVMMTGTYPMYSGIHDFSGNSLNPQQPTLASILRQHGYVTGAVLGSAVLDHRFGLNQGFDFYYDHFDFNGLTDRTFAVRADVRYLINRYLQASLDYTWRKRTANMPDDRTFNSGPFSENVVSLTLKAAL